MSEKINKNSTANKSNSPYTPSFYDWPRRARETPYNGRAKAIEKCFQRVDISVERRRM